jgi:hypothetical protein
LASKEGLFDVDKGYTNLVLQGMYDGKPFQFESRGNKHLATYRLSIPSRAHHRVAHDVSTITVSTTTAPQVHLIIDVAAFLNGLSFDTSSTLSEDQMNQFVSNYSEAIIIDHVH